MNFSKFCFLTLLTLISFSAHSELKIDHRIPLNGGEGWDYLSIEPASQRLFITRSNRVDVLNLKDEKFLGSITSGVDGAHGVAFASKINKGFLTCGKSAKVISFDLQTLNVIKEIPVGKKADAILFEEKTSRVFSFNGEGTISIIDAKTDTVIKTLKIEGTPEFAVTDGQGKIYFNNEDKNNLSEIDAEKMEISRTWPLQGCEGPSGLAADFANQRLFSVCHNQLMLISDIKNGKSISKLPIQKGPDAAIFDKNQAFSSNGSGTLTVVREKTPDQFEVVQDFPTQVGARTMALDPLTHNIYLISAKYDKPDPNDPKHRPKIIPGTVELLVVKQ